MAKVLDLAWGAKGIGKVIGKNPREAQYLLEIGAIRAARKISAKKRSQYVASISGLQAQFGGELTEATEDET
jgi:hypothetical protein